MKRKKLRAYIHGSKPEPFRCSHGSARSHRRVDSTEWGSLKDTYSFISSMLEPKTSLHMTPSTTSFSDLTASRSYNVSWSLYKKQKRSSQLRQSKDEGKVYQGHDINNTNKFIRCSKRIKKHTSDSLGSHISNDQNHHQLVLQPRRENSEVRRIWMEQQQLR